jgi:hypothetical protein
MDGRGSPLWRIDDRGSPLLGMDGRGSPLWRMDGRGSPLWRMDGRGSPLWRMDGRGSPLILQIRYLRTVLYGIMTEHRLVYYIYTHTHNVSTLPRGLYVLEC